MNSEKVVMPGMESMLKEGSGVQILTMPLLVGTNRSFTGTGVMNIFCVQMWVSSLQRHHGSYTSFFKISHDNSTRFTGLV